MKKLTPEDMDIYLEESDAPQDHIIITNLKNAACLCAREDFSSDSPLIRFSDCFMKVQDFEDGEIPADLLPLPDTVYYSVFWLNGCWDFAKRQ